VPGNRRVLCIFPFDFEAVMRRMIRLRRMLWCWPAMNSHCSLEEALDWKWTIPTNLFDHYG